MAIVFLILLLLRVSLQLKCEGFTACTDCVERQQCVYAKITMSNYLCAEKKNLMDLTPIAVYRTKSRCQKLIVMPSNRTELDMKTRDMVMFAEHDGKLAHLHGQSTTRKPFPSLTTTPTYISLNHESTTKKPSFSVSPGVQNKNYNTIKAPSSVSNNSHPIKTQDLKNVSTGNGYNHTPVYQLNSSGIHKLNSSSVATFPPAYILHEMILNRTTSIPRMIYIEPNISSGFTTPMSTQTRSSSKFLQLKQAPPSNSMELISSYKGRPSIMDSFNMTVPINKHLLTLREQNVDALSMELKEELPTSQHTRPTTIEPLNLKPTYSMVGWGASSLSPKYIHRASTSFTQPSQYNMEISRVKTPVTAEKGFQETKEYQIVQNDIIKAACKLEKLFRKFGDLYFLNINNTPAFKWIRFQISNPILLSFDNVCK